MTFPRTNSGGGQHEDLLQPARPRFVVAEQEPAPVEAPVRMGLEGREYDTAERDARTSPTPPERCANVIAGGARWKGSLTIQDSVRIDGQLSGDIDAKGTVHIAEGAMVEAKIKAAFVVISGSFKGEVRCSERLELLPKSRVQGDLVTKLLNVHEGATIDGSIRMSADKIAELEGRANERGNGSRASRAAEEAAV